MNANITIMTTLKEIFKEGRPLKEIVNDLKQKTVEIPEWNTLKKDYDPKEHPVMDKIKYRDYTDEDGNFVEVTRIALDWQRLAARRMTELTFGIPVKRVFKAKNNGEQQVADAINAILKKNRIDSLNIERGNMLFGGCEFATLWYSVEDKNNLYGFQSNLKLRCRNYSQMKGNSIYPIFDENDDLIVLSFGYSKKIKEDTAEYLDVYTAEKHIRYKTFKGETTEEINEPHTVGKIPAIYCYRSTPIWEDTSNIVYETEWTLSRNGNYIRKNSKPIIAVFADEQIDYGKEEDENKEHKAVMQFPQGSDMKYVTWGQAIESIKYQIDSLKNEYFSSLQLPDMSYENMKSTPMSGEARKMMFIDSQLKVIDESGRLLEVFDRELNVIKAFLKQMQPAWSKDIDSLEIETLITPFNISDEKETINNIMALTAGKAILPIEEAVRELGWSGDVKKTMELLQKESKGDVFEAAE
jgi:SPP1 family phage portal protein